MFLDFSSSETPVDDHWHKVIAFLAALSEGCFACGEAEAAAAAAAAAEAEGNIWFKTAECVQSHRGEGGSVQLGDITQKK